jgi:hypothetical protein
VYGVGGRAGHCVYGVGGRAGHSVIGVCGCSDESANGIGDGTRTRASGSAIQSQFMGIPYSPQPFARFSAPVGGTMPPAHRPNGPAETSEGLGPGGWMEYDWPMERDYGPCPGARTSPHPAMGCPARPQHPAMGCPARSQRPEMGHATCPRQSAMRCPGHPVHPDTE